MALQMINSAYYGGNGYPFSLPYGACSTAASTAAKTVAVDCFSLETGATVIVKFTNANSAANPTLNVNSTGAKSIKRYGTTSINSGTGYDGGWHPGATIMFVYDGTNWVQISDQNQQYWGTF